MHTSDRLPARMWLIRPAPGCRCESLFDVLCQVLLMTATSTLQVHFVDAIVKPAGSNPFLEHSQHLSSNREPVASNRIPLANQAARRNCNQAGMPRRQGGLAKRGTS